MRHSYRLGFLWLLLLAGGSAGAQPAAATWEWVMNPIAAPHDTWAQTVDAARHRLYLLSATMTTQQCGAVLVPAGFSLHTYDATTGQLVV